MAQTLKTELLQLIEELSGETERKHVRHVNKFDTFSLQAEGKFTKLFQDTKKALKLAEKVSIQGPSGGIY